jgi:hypothetical protein
VAIAQELAIGLKDLVHGVQLVTSTDRVDTIFQLLEQVR